jgi:hypothetical protein
LGYDEPRHDHFARRKAGNDADSVGPDKVLAHLALAFESTDGNAYPNDPAQLGGDAIGASIADSRWFRARKRRRHRSSAPLRAGIHLHHCASAGGLRAATAAIRHLKSSQWGRDRHQERAAQVKSVLNTARLSVMPSETHILPLMVGDSPDTLGLLQSEFCSEANGDHRGIQDCWAALTQFCSPSVMSAL